MLLRSEDAGQCAWVQIFKSKYSDFDFNLAERQNIKISPKYQNKISVQNSKISAVSTPILTIKASFFSIFQALPEKKKQKTPQNFRNRTKLLHQNVENFRKFAKMCCILIFWLYVVFWYFTGISYSYFEICENLHPVFLTCVLKNDVSAEHALFLAEKYFAEGKQSQADSFVGRGPILSLLSFNHYFIIDSL